MPYVENRKRRCFFVSNFAAVLFVDGFIRCKSIKIADNGAIALLFMETLWKNFLMKS